MGLMHEPARTAALLVAAILACAPAAAAELYKWVDERGVTNYSNTPPARTGDGKPATLVEDRLSVYTPEEPVTEALERAKARQSVPPQPIQRAAPSAELERRVAPPAPSPPIVSNPCANPGDPNCGAFLYDSFPIFQRRRPAPLAQPQLPPGTTAGNVTAPGNYIPGQSGSAPPQPQVSRNPSKAGPPRAREGERDLPAR